MKTTAKRVIAQGLLGTAILLASDSFAQTAIIGITIDGSAAVVPIQPVREGKITTWSFVGNLTLGGDNGAVLTGLNVTADPDPFLGYAIGITDIGAPSVFGFVFGTPIVPTSAPGAVTSSFSASLTDGGNGSISITPVAPGVPVDGDGITEIHVVTDGFPLTNDGRDLGPAAAFGGGASVHGPFNEIGPLPGPGPWIWMQINVTFAGSGGNDFYALSGSALKVETPRVPESGSAWLLGVLGLGSCLLIRRFGLLAACR